MHAMQQQMITAFLAAPALLGAPFLVAGGLRIVYDLLLFEAQSQQFYELVSTQLQSMMLNFPDRICQFSS